MSVINKMLQDLEQRQPAQATANPSAKVPQPGSTSPSTSIWLLLILLVLLSIVWFSKDKLLAEPETAATKPSIIIEKSDPDNKDTAAPSQQHEQQKTEHAEPAAIMAVLSSKEPAPNPATVAATDPAAEPAERAGPALTSPPLPATKATLATQPVVMTTQEVQVPDPVRAQASVDKQPLSVAAQRHNMLLRAGASEAAGDTSGAIVIWQQIVSLQPAAAEGYLNLARLWLKQQQIVTASQVLLQARQNGVVNAEINMQLAQLAVRQGQWQQALEFLSDQFELAEEPEYFGFKATVLQQLQQHAAALGWYQRLQQLQPEQGRWSLGAAVASEQLGQPLQAHQYYLHAWQYRQGLSASSQNFIQQRLKATEP